MKQLFLIAAIAFSLNAMAQAGTANLDSMKMYHKMHKMKDDCVMMKNGKMVSIINGQTMPMDSMTTMRNGAVVMTDGQVKVADGDMVQLKEGDCVYIDGKIKRNRKKNNAM